MRKTLFATVISTLALLPLSSHAAEWVRYSINSSEKEINLYERSNIRCKGDLCAGWIATVNIHSKKGYDLTLLYEQVDCTTYALKDLSEDDYLRGKKVKSWAVEDKFVNYPPDTRGFNMARAICEQPKNFVYKGSIFDMVPRIQADLREELK